jgi:hypothetical protein
MMSFGRLAVFVVFLEANLLTNLVFSSTSWDDVNESLNPASGMIPARTPEIIYVT